MSLVSGSQWPAALSEAGTVFASSNAGIVGSNPTPDPPVASAPRPLEKQASMQVRKDQTAVLPCYVEGNPPPAIRWFRQDHHQLRALAEADDRIYRAGECLIIQHVVESDAGRWVCVANNTAGVERMDVVLHVTSPLNVVIQPSGQLTVDIGGKATLTCHVSGSSPHLPATRTWLKDGHVVGPGGEALVLEKVQREDAGMYQCLVRSEDDSAQSSLQLRLGGITWAEEERETERLHVATLYSWGHLLWLGTVKSVTNLGGH